MGDWKQAANTLQALMAAKETIPIRQQVIDLQTQFMALQSEYYEAQNKIRDLENENKNLVNLKKFQFKPDHNYLIDPDQPSRPLCPACTLKNKIPVPLESTGSGYCFQCKGNYQ